MIKRPKIDLVALTNALTDIIINVEEEDLNALGIKIGSTTGLSHINPTILSQILKKTNPKYLPAGSPANTVFSASALGLKTALIGSVGHDNAGNNYLKQLKKARIKPFFKQTKGKSGICYIPVTPDCERTNIANIGVSWDFPNISKLENINPNIFHTSAYEVVSNPDKTKEIIDYFKNKGAKLSFDLASESMIRQERKTIEQIVEKTDILFATEEEARELVNLSPFKALKELSDICPIVSLKRGSKGSIIIRDKEKHKIPIYKTKLVNTCGAGDSYAAGFLFAYLKGFSLKECGCMGSYIASRICNSKKSHLNPKINLYCTTETFK